MTLDTDGFLIAQGVLDIEEVERLRELIADGESGHDRSACIRNVAGKIPEISHLANSSGIRRLLPDPEMQLVRSLLFDKTPESNWPVAWHQDLTIAVQERMDSFGFGPWSVKQGVPHVQPPIEILMEMVTLRIHLDDTPAENGALLVLPGSHRCGILDGSQIETYREESNHCLECAAGDVILMRPLLLHSSGRSLTPSHRRVLHFEYASPDALPYPLAWAQQ